MKPLSDTRSSFDPALIMRVEENPRYVNEFAMSFLRRVAPKPAPAKQMNLP